MSISLLDLDDQSVLDIRLMWATGATFRMIMTKYRMSTRLVAKLVEDSPRGACACGRPGGHRGHCAGRMVGIRACSKPWTMGGVPKWTAAADAILTRDYPLGRATEELVAEIGALLGHKMTFTAIWSRTGKLGLKRPAGYFAMLRSRGVKIGRPRGSKDKHVRAKSFAQHRRTYAGRTEIAVIANTSDLVFQWMIEADQAETKMALQREMRCLRPGFVALIDRQVQSQGSAISKNANYHARKAADRKKPKPLSQAEHAALRGAEKSALKPHKPRKIQLPLDEAARLGRFMPRHEVEDLLALKALNRSATIVRNVLPTVRADPMKKGIPYTMGMSGADPFREARLRQMLEGRRGHL